MGAAESFADKYVMSANSNNLMDDERHHATEALAAAALADATSAGLGSLLCRVKYIDGTQSKAFESGSANLAQLLRIWLAAVTEKGEARRWVTIRAEWDISAARALYRRVAEASLAHWLDGKCKACSGTGVRALMGGGQCAPCKGSGKTEVACAGGFERERVKDMIGELENLVISHNARAASRMRREPSA